MPIPVESFFLPSGTGGTLQQRIRQMVADGILSGRFRAGEKLPSSRGLARHLGVSRITVTLAYAELVAGDYLAARGRSGYFVSHAAPGPPAFGPGAAATGTAVDWDQRTGRRFSRAPDLARPVDWRSYPFPFIYGQADATLFDHHNWRQCALQALGRREFEALAADSYTRDDPLLIEYILRTILPRRGISAGPEEVLLTLGAQNALWMAAEVLLGPGRLAVQENPGYAGLRAILDQNGCARRSVPVDGQGLPPEAIPSGADVVFVTPSHQSPTNATMPVARRKALLDRARAEDFVVVEDDYEFEMSFLKPASPALKSLDGEGRVIYVGSFSKSLFPGLRLGYMVAPEPFIREARSLRTSVLRHPPGHIQRTAAYFLALGHYDTLLARMAQTFRRRRQTMEEAIGASGLSVAGAGAFGGSSFWMQAPPGTDCDALALRLRARGVLIEPGRVFFDPAAAPAHFYRLAYSSIAQPRIAEGIGLIAEELYRAPA
jgi:GntR family transcriptional regulator/MocR family aminotransferase